MAMTSEQTLEDKELEARFKKWVQRFCNGFWLFSSVFFMWMPYEILMAPEYPPIVFEQDDFDVIDIAGDSMNPTGVCMWDFSGDCWSVSLARPGARQLISAIQNREPFRIQYQQEAVLFEGGTHTRLESIEVRGVVYESTHDDTVMYVLGGVSLLIALGSLYCLLFTDPIRELEKVAKKQALKEAAERAAEEDSALT